MDAEVKAGSSERFEVEGCDTIPKLFWHQVKARDGRIAFREKELGIWRSTTWREYGQRARLTGMGLVKLGLEAGEVVSILADTIPEWLYADMGTMGAGGISNGIYPTDAAKQVEYICNDSRSRFMFVENEEQLDKWLEVRERCPLVRKAIIFDMEGLSTFSDPDVMSFDDLLALGREHDAANPSLWEERIAASQAESLALLVYTSGTTGPSKGAMLSHRNVIFQLGNADAFFPVGDNEETLAFLPLCHVAERTFTAFLPLRTGAIANFAESPDTVPENLREVAPTTFFAVPRLWERFYSGITIRMREATWIGRQAYRWAIGVGLKVAEQELDGRKPSAGQKLLLRLADFLVLDNIKRSMGMHRVAFAVTGAAPIAPDLIKWYRALGIDMREGYGQTENCGLATGMPDQIKLGTVGTAAPNTEVKISPEGEILLRGPHVFMGYLNQPDKTAETLRDGWLHTGDVGFLDNSGYLKITDRMKDIIITAGGKNITPSEIENQLKFSPYISDAVVVGDRRKFLTCLVMIDYDNVAKHAQDNNVPFTDFASLCRSREVQDLIWAEIEKVNRNFARVETIKKFRLIEQQLTAEDDEVTPTMKLKRKFVNEKYKIMIDGMYAEAA
ncbi:long-chain fatty acid--CoA ligase [Reyranella sp. CPCC 100927]|uniref:AMP-dependent synthetase/ligase n=1 Tax=Reyranella sp. CPCC 100927 TaxID=2599616 RepID=UPI0011B7D0EF|nr:AMP-binding protein [Reyranella sp. CPCC 100927]TWT10048.1 long-chain fatty acid--CoA ligase [Reyranella sp. CPCC 100927]